MKDENFPKFERWEGNKLIPQEEAERRINIICNYKNYTFRGFCDKEGNNCEWYGRKTYLKLHCNTCGNNWNTTSYNNFLNGCGCRKCGNKEISKAQSLKMETVLERIDKKCKEKNYIFLGFCDKDGNDCEWYGNQTYLKLHCNICGNNWNKCTYVNFTRGRGCPKCNASHLEEEIRLFLQENKIEFEEQKKFSWLGRQSLDFYLSIYNVGIECQGKQHFKEFKHFGGIKKLLKTQSRDKRKKQLCEEHGVKLLYYSNLGIEYPYEVFEDKEKLLEEIVKK